MLIFVRFVSVGVDIRNENTQHISKSVPFLSNTVVWRHINCVGFVSTDYMWKSLVEEGRI